MIPITGGCFLFFILRNPARISSQGIVRARLSCGFFEHEPAPARILRI